MIVKLTWHGEPIGTLEVQFVWPPPLDRGALLPLLSAASGSAAISVVFQLSGALDALELDLARPGRAKWGHSTATSRHASMSSTCTASSLRRWGAEAARGRAS
jgi:hypothetical protein